MKWKINGVQKGLIITCIYEPSVTIVDPRRTSRIFRMGEGGGVQNSKENLNGKISGGGGGYSILQV